MTIKPIPRLPVFGWHAMRGGSDDMPCLLDQPQLTYTTSGRAAILLGLEVLGVTAGDIVLLPTYHCPTMVAPVVHLGAKPVFFPIDERGAPNIAWLRAHAPAVAKVLVMPHYFGWPQPMAKLRSWCDEHGTALLEDCAHALFGVSDGKPIGQWGDVAIGSLTKFLPTPDGGCLILNGAQEAPQLHPAAPIQQVKAWVDVAEVAAGHDRIGGLNKTVRLLLGTRRRAQMPVQAVKATWADPVRGVSGCSDASGSELVVDGRLAHQRLTVASTRLAKSLPRQRNVQGRRLSFERLLAGLRDKPGMRPLITELPADCAPYVFPLWVDRPDPGFAALRAQGLPVFRWDRLWPGVPVLAGDQGPRWGFHVVQVACHQDLSASDVQRIVQALIACYGQPAEPAPGRSSVVPVSAAASA